MPRPRHHPAAIAEVVLHNEPPAARSVAQLLSRADQVAASRRGRSGAQDAGPRRSTTRLQPDGVLLRDTNRSFSQLVALLDGPDRSRLRAAGERTRCSRTYSDSRTGRRSPTRRWWSAAWLRGGGLTRRARWKPLDGLTRAPGLLLTPVPGAQPRGGEVTRRTSQAVEPRAQPWLGYELARRVGRKCAATGTTCPPLAGGQPPWPAR